MLRSTLSTSLRGLPPKTCTTIIKWSRWWEDSQIPLTSGMRSYQDYMPEENSTKCSSIWTSPSSRMDRSNWSKSLKRTRQSLPAKSGLEELIKEGQIGTTNWPNFMESSTPPSRTNNTFATGMTWSRSSLTPKEELRRLWTRSRTLCPKREEMLKSPLKRNSKRTPPKLKGSLE